MSQKTTSAPELHADHRHWNSEISMWQEDIENWQHEHETAEKQLNQVVAQLAEHAKSLEAHAHKLAVISDGANHHEKTLKESLLGGSDPVEDDALVERHEEQAYAIAAQRVAHERIKKHHHTAMAQVAILKAALEAAM